MQRGRSDCLRACLASIFEIPWEEAPATEREEGEDEQGRIVSQHNTVNAWLTARGLVEWQLTGGGDRPLLRRGETIHTDDSRTPANYVWPYPVAAHYVGAGASPRGDHISHAVVMFAGEIVHDPYPAQDMTIDRIESIYVYIARLG
jgi:hypothetical protein